MAYIENPIQEGMDFKQIANNVAGNDKALQYESRYYHGKFEKIDEGVAYCDKNIVNSDSRSILTLNINNFKKYKRFILKYSGTIGANTSITTHSPANNTYNLIVVNSSLSQIDENGLIELQLLNDTHVGYIVLRRGNYLGDNGIRFTVSGDSAKLTIFGSYYNYSHKNQVTDSNIEFSLHGEIRSKDELDILGITTE